MVMVLQPDEQCGYSFAVPVWTLDDVDWRPLTESRRVWVNKELVIDRTGANPHLDDRIKKD